MESSRRAVEAYWRSRMIDNATKKKKKIAPIYRLDEICETLRSSHISIVKEMSEYILKRLDHKSPLVKQKALRLIKYSVGKAGVEFKREMQRHSGALRQLFHYRGQVDALKGDALNKAVRDTAHEAIAAIFASDEKPAATEEINKRIQGFGNSNFEMPVEDRKSFLSDVVGFGSASIRQGLSTISGNPLAGKGNTNGSYRGPSLRKSLTAEREIFERNGREESSRESQYSFDSSEPRDGSWNHDSRVSTSGKTNGNMGLNQARGSGHEERLLDTITAPGGVRLQPSRETIQSFLLEASKLDAAVLSHALESKLQSHSWQAMNFGALGNSFAQQQLLATMANWQQFGKGADFRNAGFLHTGYGTDMGFGSSFADGFHFSSDPMQGHASTTENPRKEETRAFDFISEHISAARDVKRYGSCLSCQMFYKC